MRRIVLLSLFGLGWPVLAQAQIATPQAGSTVKIHQLSRPQLDSYLAQLASTEPDPVKRLGHLAEATVGQMHQAKPLGEGSFDSHDPKPLYALDKSDTTTFVEQTLAMAVTSNAADFNRVLQRIRYKDGVIATAGRNHNLLADWVKNNAWLLNDVSGGLWGEMAWIPAHQIVKRKTFLKDNFDINTDIPDEKFIGTFVPRCFLHKALADVRDGDIVLVITGNDRQQFCTEMGIMRIDSADVENPWRIVYSIAPQVTKDKFRKVIWRKDTLGFKFLRLRSDAVSVSREAAQTMAQRLPE